MDVTEQQSITASEATLLGPTTDIVAYIRTKLTPTELEVLEDMIRRAHMPQEHTNPQKRQNRIADLELHPEKKIRIKKDPLLRIMPEVQALMCNFRSSVAVDLAIVGSDIDGGLVITKTPTTTEAQMQLIQELRNQGFVTYHPHEIAAVRAEFEQAEQDYRENKIDILEVNKKNKKFLDIEGQVLNFASEQELINELTQQIKSGKANLTHNIDALLAGTKIL